MYNLAECIRISAVMLKPFLPVCPNKILSLFGIDGETVKDFESVKSFGGLKAGINVEKAMPIFPRIDVKKELEEIEKMVLARRAEKKVEEKKPAKTQENEQKFEEITIDDFAKVQLKTGVVLTAEKVEKADKLLKLTVDTGSEKRTIVSGIAKHYTPEEMVGKRVIVVANLKPVKLRGILSEGMLLCAEDENGNFSLVTTLSEVGAGAGVR
jgi:methionyl-tRNA synthetase